MSSSEDTLVEIQHSEWPKLRDLYANHKIPSYAYNLLLTGMNMIQQNPQLNVHIYSLNGDWERDGTFIMNDHNYIFAETLSANYDRVLKALNCLDNKEDLLFYVFSERLLPTFRQHCINSNISWDAFQPDGTFWYHATKERVQQFNIDLPVGVTLAPLQTRHVEQVNRLWPHRRRGSENFIERLIRYNLSVGAYDANGHLMAWALQQPIGCIGVLQVLDEHKCKGLGSLIVRYMSKQLVAKNFEVFAPVVFANSASCSLFDRLAFHVVDKIYWGFGPGGRKNQIKSAL